MRAATVSPIELSDWLMARGKHFVSTEDVAALVGVEPAVVPISLQRPRDAHKIVSVTKGGWVPVPPEYREAGAPPPIHFIDALMDHLGHPYYVGFLSAARLHGASHQVPMALQVVTPVLLRSRSIGGSRLQYIRRSATAQRSTQLHNVPTGRVTIATPETVVFDIVEAPMLAGGLGNVATVIGELLVEGALKGDAVARAAPGFPTAIIQRVGHLVEHMAAEAGAQFSLDAVQDTIESASYTALDPHAPSHGERNERWRVVINTEIEHEL
jgi:predicted transcriptional regulator of viral defense system